MAFGIKYRFRFEDVNGVLHTVNIVKDGYSGSITTRPLGGSPVIRMQENGPFHATSVNLKLECHTDGEFTDLYTSDPHGLRVDIYRGGTLSAGGTLVWTGFIATEIYAEPDIAPPYDVDVTATDGLGALKEYTFEAAGGGVSLRSHLQTILAKTGQNLVLNTASALREYAGTAIEFMDEELIDLDFLAGENCYDVLGKILDTLHATITQVQGQWLIIRETDAVVSSGSISVIRSTTRGDQPSSSASMSIGASVGKMGTARMWPVGYLTRRISPAKREMTVRAPWHPKDGAPAIEDWTGNGETSAGSTWRYLGHLGGTGDLHTAFGLLNFNRDLVVSVHAGALWANSSLSGAPYLKVLASWNSGGETKYFDPESGWNTSAAAGDEISVKNTIFGSDTALAKKYEVTIPHPGDPNPGTLMVYAVGHEIEVCRIEVSFDLGKGYEDHIVINNGARGDGGTKEILGGRRITENNMPLIFVAGVWYGGPSTGVPTFSDGSNSQKDFMSLTALSYAKSLMASRIETTGTIDVPSGMTCPPIMILHHSMYSLFQTYEWDIRKADLSFKALSLPTATLSVESESVTSIPDNTAVSGGSTSSGGGVSWGSTSSNKSPLTVDGTTKTVLLEDWSELPNVSSSDNGKVLMVVDGAWAKGEGSAFNGGEITQDLWLHTGGANYGSKLWIGDKGSGDGYVYLHEDTDDHLKIYADKGISFQVGSGYSVDVPGYAKYVLLQSESQMPASPDSETLYLIPET